MRRSDESSCLSRRKVYVKFVCLLGIFLEFGCAERLVESWTKVRFAFEMHANKITSAIQDANK